jgi:hypothetical protein
MHRRDSLPVEPGSYQQRRVWLRNALPLLAVLGCCWGRGIRSLESSGRRAAHGGRSRHQPARGLPFYLLSSLRPGLRDAIDDYSARLAALYAAISRVSGANVIVDTSRDPTFACLLMRIPGSDVRIVHLVRDSRAVSIFVD